MTTSPTTPAAVTLASLNPAGQAALVAAGAGPYWRTITGWRRRGDRQALHIRTAATLEAAGILERFHHDQALGLRLTELGWQAAAILRKARQRSANRAWRRLERQRQRQEQSA